MGVKRGEQGFTLIELLIVVIILGIVSATVAFNVKGFLSVGGGEAARMQLSTLQTAIYAAMAANTVGTVHDREVGEDGSSVTPPSQVVIIDAAHSDTGEDVPLSTYIQSDIKGKWEWDENGLITEGKYWAGGEEFKYEDGSWSDKGDYDPDPDPDEDED